MVNRFADSNRFWRFSASTLAATEITWWHAMGGQLGETVNQLATDFNASQSDYKLTPVYKGSYTETLTAGIAAFRAGQAPNILQVFDAGAATIMSSKGVAKPVQDLMIESGYPFTAQDYIAGVRNFYADNTEKWSACHSTAQRLCCTTTKTCWLPLTRKRHKLMSS